MIRPAPPASKRIAVTLVASAVAAVILVAANSEASGINLLQPVTTPQVRIVFDASGSLSDEDAATAKTDGECVAIADPQQRSSSGFGSVSWTHSRLSWQWDRGREPSIVYVMCLDRAGSSWNGSGGGGGASGMNVFAALAAANAASAVPTNAPASLATPMPAPTSFEIGPTPFISWPDAGSPSPDDPTAPTATISIEPVLFDLPTMLPTMIGMDVSGAPLPDGDTIAPFVAPAPIGGPGDMSPVPEPATWLLMGTGLAVAWCATRRHR